jgi:hypothetical protein
MMRFTVTYCKSAAGYSEFQAQLIAAIFDQLGLALLREVPRVAVVEKGRSCYSDSHSPAAAA